ncbi:MAG: 2-dehydropantoate 2-reductase [Spirochaetales bacterium]|nr:2-dehydropantoate 2-reductase [Spirochaetales bacterium]
MKNIMIFGIGGIGGYLGAMIGSRLPEASLTFIARGKHLEAIKEKGLRFVREGEEDRVVRPALAADSAASAGVQDLVFICVKSYDLAAACREIAPCVGPETIVVPVLNGMDIHGRIREHLSEGVLLSGATYVSAYISGPGVVRFQTGREVFVLGKSPDCPDFDPSGFLSFMKDAGVNCSWFDDPRPAIWRKYLFISPYSMVGAWSGKTMGALLEDPELKDTVDSIQREVYAVGLASGVDLEESDVKDAENFAAGLDYSTTTSFQRDYADPVRKNELDLYGGAVVRLGESLGVETPVAGRIYGELKNR